jgi:hypothetical protein
MGMTCIIPAAIGLYKYKGMDKKFHPFVAMMILTVMVEIISYIAEKNNLFQKFDRIPGNLYMLPNFVFFLYLVWKNGYLKKIPAQLFFLIALLLVVVNLICNNSFLGPWLYALCFVSSVMLFVAVDILSKQVLSVKIKLVDNFWFWFSSTSVLYNAFNLLIFGNYSFALFGTSVGKAIGTIWHFVNIACQLLFAFAMIKTPVGKKNYTDKLT